MVLDVDEDDVWELFLKANPTIEVVKAVSKKITPKAAAAIDITETTNYRYIKADIDTRDLKDGFQIVSLSDCGLLAKRLVVTNRQACGISRGVYQWSGKTTMHWKWTGMQKKKGEPRKFEQLYGTSATHLVAVCLADD